jgi:hypothetical protein
MATRVVRGDAKGHFVDALMPCFADKSCTRAHTDEPAPPFRASRSFSILSRQFCLHPNALQPLSRAQPFAPFPASTGTPPSGAYSTVLHPQLCKHLMGATSLAT